ADDWSMTVNETVIALKGEPAVLPCTFTYPPSDQSHYITAIWKVKEFHNGPEIFRCIMENVTSADCIVHKNEKGRYRLAGDPKQKNLSLQIDTITYEDRKKYFCRVELSSRTRATFQTPAGTDLHVIRVVPATILNLTAVRGTGGFSLLCMAEGKPLPTITWIGPGNKEIPVTKNLVSQHKIPPYQIQTEIKNVTEDGIYTCKAVNKHGHIEKKVKIEANTQESDFSPEHIVIIVLIVLVLCFIIGILYWKRKGMFYFR
uniref:Ig-like domain-containing protein n=1 Tax=Latimeria chalumnae TaxID=7897 RepID=H3APH6_LATCH